MPPLSPGLGTISVPNVRDGEGVCVESDAIPPDGNSPGGFLLLPESSPAWWWLQAGKSRSMPLTAGGGQGW